MISWSEFRFSAKSILSNNKELSEHCEHYAKIYNSTKLEVFRWYLRGGLEEDTDLYMGIHNRLSKKNQELFGRVTL